MQERAMTSSIIENDIDDEETLDEEMLATSTMSSQTSGYAIGHTQVANGTVSSYPANITAACHEASASGHQAKCTIVDESKLEKRRKCNRLSAQRWRMRKRSKFSDLQGQIRMLQKEHVQLEVEKSKLQAELTFQLALTKAQTTHLPSSFVDSRLECSRQALRFSQCVPIDHGLESTGKVQRSPGQGDRSAFVTHSDSFCTRPPSSPMKSISSRSHAPVPVQSPTFVPGFPECHTTAKVSHDQLMAMLKVASAPRFSSVQLK
jgi:hypothetical protein